MQDKRKFDYDAKGRTIIDGSKALTLEAKWWAIEEMMKLYAENELPDNFYEKIFDERWEIEKKIAAWKPTNCRDILVILRMTRKAYANAWGPVNDKAHPCPTGQNILSALDNVIEALENKEIITKHEQRLLSEIQKAAQDDDAGEKKAG